MLFGEKYEDTVVAIQYASSIELCGGTHVSSTQKFYLLKLRVRVLLQEEGLSNTCFDVGI